MVKLIPDDHHQALRIRRFSIAFAGYLLLLAMILFLVFFGYMRGRGMLTFGLMAAGLITANMVIYLMFFSGVNQKFKDPSLTIPQLLVGIVFVSLLAYFSPNSVRGIVLLVYILIFVFGTFRLRLREFFLLVAVTEVLYGLSMFCLYQRLPAAVDFKLEFIRAVILAASLLWISIMASYIADLRRKIKLLATHDALTNIYNRREGFSILNREKAFADRTGFPFSICMIDIDDFKAVNDTHGHQAGDIVLKTFAETLKENIRSEDYVARYGGEEFVVVFINFKCRDGNAGCVQRLLTVTRNLSFPSIPGDLRITASMGVASYRFGESVDSLVDRSDRALYEAKAAGKNTIVYKNELYDSDGC